MDEFDRMAADIGFDWKGDVLQNGMSGLHVAGRVLATGFGGSAGASLADSSENLQDQGGLLKDWARSNTKPKEDPKPPADQSTISVQTVTKDTPKAAEPPQKTTVAQSALRKIPSKLEQAAFAPSTESVQVQKKAPQGSWAKKHATVLIAGGAVGVLGLGALLYFRK